MSPTHCSLGACITIVLSGLAVACLQPRPGVAPTGSEVISPPSARPPFGPGGTLEGPIAQVDGVDAPHVDGVLEVSVQCHVVRTNTTHVAERDHGRLEIRLPPVDFVLYVQPGYHYRIVREFGAASAPSPPVTTTCVIEDGEGNAVREVAPTSDANEIAECLAGE